MKEVIAKRNIKQRLTVVMILLCCVAGSFYFLFVSAANLSVRSIKIGSPEPSSVTTYQVKFDITATAILGSVQIQFCSNDPFPGLPCAPPTGLDVSGGTLVDQTGATGFSIDPSTTANNLILSRIPVNTTPRSTSYTFDGMVNPSAPATYYVRLLTYTSNDASGSPTLSGGLAFHINANPISLSAEVPPYLLFCTGITINDNACNSITGNYINFGNLSASSSRSATSELLVTTNAEFGYIVTLSGNTMISGNNIIQAISGGDVSRPGVNQFGLNLRANTTPAVGADPIGPGLGQPTASYNTPNVFRFNSGDIIASSTQPEDTHKYTVSYLVNINNSLPVGFYVTTLTYTSLANF